MAREEIYKRAFTSLLNGKLTKQELWEVMSEHFDSLDSKNKELLTELNKYERKYKHLLKQVNEAHEEHKKLFGE